MERTSHMPKIAGVSLLFFLKTLLFSYILTAVMLTLLAFLLYQLNLNEKIVAVAIIVIYVAATMFAGFVAGKRMGSRKFLWGLAMGCAYFLVLATVSICAGKGAFQAGGSSLTTLALCTGGGMLGGMLS